MPGSDDRFTIGELAGELGITTRAIRFYEANGLIAPERRGVARSYTRRDRARLRLILRGKNLGFTPRGDQGISRALRCRSGPSHPVEALRPRSTRTSQALNHKRADLDRTLRELKEIRAQVVGQLEKQ